MTADSSALRPKPVREVKPAELAFGTVKTAGGSIDVRISKGRENLEHLGLEVGKPVLVVGVPGEAVLLVSLPKVIAKSNISEILDRVKVAVDKLSASYQYTVVHQEQLFRLLAQPRRWTKKARILRETKKRSSSQAARQ